MNSRHQYKIDGILEGRVQFEELPEEHEEIFHKYMDMAGHLRELDQLYRMMHFNLKSIFKYYNLQFNDYVQSNEDEDVDAIQLNALIGNAVSSARTLVDSMEVFDKVYISEDNMFKTCFISSVYDDNFSYRFIDTMRNYMQHGHVPVSYNEAEHRIYFHLSEILDVKHMKMNARLKNKLKNVERELVDYNVTDTRLTCVFMLYEYFFQVHSLYSAFYRYIEWDVLNFNRQVKEMVKAYPDYILHTDGLDMVCVYVDENNFLHGFPATCDMDELFEQNKKFADSEFDDYNRSNGNLFTIQISYALEYRMPLMLIVGEDEYSENLAEFCVRHGNEIRYLSFDDYYGCSDMHTINGLYPFIQFEDGVRWNVPYDEVTIADFLRTFPEVREKGLKVLANNVGGAADTVSNLLQQWRSFSASAQMFLQTPEIQQTIGVIDWAARIAFVYGGYQNLKKSFSRKREKKPTMDFVIKYIRRKENWNLMDLMKNLDAERELLNLVLKSCGYVSTDGINYYFDEIVANKIEQERKKEINRRYDNHGTNVDCERMNEAVEYLNSDLLYYAVLLMEQGQSDEFESRVQLYLQPLQIYNQYIYWDKDFRSVRFVEQFSERFIEETEEKIRIQVSEIDEALLKEIFQMEEC